MGARDRDAIELRAVAPLVVSATRELIAPVLLVTNGQKTIGMTSAELLRPWLPAQVSVLLAFDGSIAVPVASWTMGRYSGVGMIDLTGAVPATNDVRPLPISGVCASIDTRGAPSAIATIMVANGKLVRELIGVHVDVVDAGGMSDDLGRLASPIDANHAGAPVEGAVLFTWFPPDPVLGRKSEVLALAMTYVYRAGTLQPRPTPAIAELTGLDDLGRALIQATPAPERPELTQITGEISETKPEKLAETLPVLDGADEYRQKRERS
ncbi:hypothetical protein BH11MYX3_BH11MYX3_17270 [soil metagenome]